MALAMSGVGHVHCVEPDLVELSKELRIDLAETASKQKQKDLINRLKIVESIRDSENRPE